MSLFDHPDLVPAAPTWRCPHCRTLQPETSRCRACSRAAVTCATCHLFRRSVASEVGYCAVDRAHSPLLGDEVRSCWAAPGASVTGAAVALGLFDEDELSSSPLAAAPSLPDATRPTATQTEPSVANEESAERSGGLVDAPHVPAGLRLTSELQRRSRENRAG